jgi:predicted permease
MADLLHDFIFAWRNACKRPANTLLIVITLGLGLGANTAMFSMAWHVLFAPLPYADGERLVALKQHQPVTGIFDTPWMMTTFADYRDQNSVFTDLIGYAQLEYTLLGEGDPFFAETGIVNWNYFGTLGIEPTIGRGFVPSDDIPGAAPVMLLGYDSWRENFGGDPELIGASLTMNDIVYTVVGVLPPTPPYPRNNDVWIPMASDLLLSDPKVVNNRQDVSAGILVNVIGKLRPEVTIEQAQREIDMLVARQKAAWPEVYPQEFAVGITPLRDELVRNSGTIILLLSGLAVVIVLIACANVANLRLAEISARNQELAIREAIGGDPARIRRQLLTESMAMALASGIVGLGCAWLTLNLVTAFVSGYSPLASEISVDGPVLIFTFLLAIGAGLLSGSALTFSSRDINKALKEGGDKITTSLVGKRKQQLLLMTQLALAFVMLTSSSLIVLSLYRLNNEDAGYDTQQILAAHIQLLGVNYRAEQQGIDFVNRLMEEARSIPGVESAAVAGFPLLQNQLYPLGTVEIEGRTPANAGGGISIFSATVTEDYFSVVNIPLLEGRMFTEADDMDSQQVVIINENFARQFFPEGNALGQRLSFYGSGNWRTVVGVVANIRSNGLDQEQGYAAYTNIRQRPTTILNLYVRTTVDPASLTNAITDAVHRIDPELAVTNVLPLTTIKADWLAPRRLVAILSGLLGLLALIIALAGVIGVISFTVSQRVREVGVHMAIGASPMQIRNLFIREGTLVYLAGLLAGLALMLLAARFLAPLLYETSAFAPAIYTASAAVLTCAVIVALYVPARTASKMSPAEALHCE